MSKIKFTKPTINFKNLVTLIKKELLLQFSTLNGFIIIAVFVGLHLILTFFWFQFIQFNKLDFTLFFEALPFTLMLILPAVTMGTIASEVKDGTIEYVLSKPVGVLEFVIAKVISVGKFLLIGLAIETVLVIIILLLDGGVGFDYGKLISQYIGAIFLVYALAAVGVFISSLFKEQIISFLTSIAVLVPFVLIGMDNIARLFPTAFTRFLNRIAILPVYSEVTNGVLRLSTIIYFVGFIAFFVGLTYFRILAMKLPSKHPKLTQMRLVSGGFIIVLILATGFGQIIPGRLDLTRNQVYSLSEGSKTIVRELSEPVTLDVYYTSDVPLQLKSTSDDLFWVLTQLQEAGGSNIRLNQYTTESDQEKRNAAEQGIAGFQVQLPDVDGSGSRIVDIFMGIKIKQGEQEELIPTVLAGTQNLEYEIVSKIRKITNSDKPKIGFLESGAGTTPFNSYAQFKSELESEYEVVSLNIEEEELEIATQENGENEEESSARTEKVLNLPEDIKALVIPGPTTAIGDRPTETILKYMQDGGALFLLVEPTNINLGAEEISATINNGSLGDFFSEDYGIEIKPEIVYDLESYQSVPVGSGIPFPYPYFPTTLSTNESTATLNIYGVTMNWGGWVQISETDTTASITKIMQTTGNAAVEAAADANPNLDRDWNTINQNSLDQFTTAVTIEETDDTSGRAVVVADASIISDFAAQYPQNYSFGMTAIQWLTQEDSLASIRSKNRTAQDLKLTDEAKTGIQYGGLISLVSLIGVAAGARFYVRKREMGRSYS